ncbi:MAG: isochorismatase family protein [Chloroflexi bacterium]|nr:isochorismatase family protein [Chloroflexota bacterium]
MEPIEKTYQAAGYGRGSIGFGKRPAVIVVDLQNAFLDPQYPLGRSEFIQAAARHTATLLDEARSSGVPIFYTVISLRPDEADRCLWKVDLSACREGWGAEVADVVKPALEDHIIKKKMPSAFFGTDLLSQLVVRNIDTVIVSGCVTSGCVRASIVDAFSHGFRTIVPEECCGDQSLEQHRANLFDVGARYADVLPLSTVLEQIRALVVAP